MSPLTPLHAFEGVEKRIEIDFFIPNGFPPDGLRGLDKSSWDAVCALCKCSIIYSESCAGYDSFILSESSLFVFPNRVMLKTCGTTLPLEGVQMIVEIGSSIGLVPMDMLYSRSSFLFPDLQLYPHNSLESELDYLANMSIGGSVVPGKSSILGDTSGRYWLIHRKQLYDSSSSVGMDTPDHRRQVGLSSNGSRVVVDIIMTGLSEECRKIYFKDMTVCDESNEERMTRSIIKTMPDFAKISGKCYDPCGYSCNGDASIRDDAGTDRYFMVHITPEKAFSYASVEVVFYQCPSFTRDVSINSDTDTVCSDSDTKILFEINKMVQRVANHFGPTQMIVTVVACDDSVSASMLPRVFENTKTSTDTAYMKRVSAYTSGNLLGEDIVASSVYFSAVASGNTGTKPTGLS
jgi:S-adenosylmethionine decarboxylase